MRNVLFTLALAGVLGLTSCAFLESQKANWEACKADVECLENAKGYQGKTELLATVAASAVPIPGAAAAPKVLGYIAFGIAMLLGGRAALKKTKKEE